MVRRSSSGVFCGLTQEAYPFYRTPLCPEGVMRCMEDYNDRRVRYYDRGAHEYDGGWQGSWLSEESEQASFEAELGALARTI